MPDDSQRLPDVRHGVHCRAVVLRAIRLFFEERGFLEVETPVRLPAPALEEHIDAVPSDGMYLRTSPELHMKRLLCSGYERIFQIGPCFRMGETGNLHNQEFSMLEWYRAGAGYMDVLADTRALVDRVSDAARDTCGCDATNTSAQGEWHLVPVRKAFIDFAGWDPVSDFDADRFDVDLVTRVEPALPVDRPVVLLDYPAPLAALARTRMDSDGRPVAERWELYIGGVELANAFSELTDAREQEERFVQCAAARRRAGKPVYPVDRQFLDALSRGMPESAGVALGVDRLVMLMAGKKSLDDILPFRESV